MQRETCRSCGGDLYHHAGCAVGEHGEKIRPRFSLGDLDEALEALLAHHARHQDMITVDLLDRAQVLVRKARRRVEEAERFNAAKEKR